MKRFLQIFLIIFIHSNIHSQSSKQTKEIKIQYKNGLEIFNILTKNDQIIFDNEKEYYWYTEYSKIKSTKGGNGGMLFNGNYKFFDEKGNLIISENYKAGLKHGESKKWNLEGELIEIVKYDNGENIYWKYHPENNEGWVEQIGKMLNDGWIKNTYDKYNNLLASQKTFIDEKSIIKKEKTKTSSYYKNSKQLKTEYTTFMLFNDLHIGEYLEYYSNGNKKFYGKLLDVYNIGIEQYVGNIRDGEWKWFKENGEIESTEKYKAIVENWENGNVKFIYSQYFDTSENKWIIHGNFYSFQEDGNGIGEITEYEYGEIKSKKD